MFDQYIFCIINKHFHNSKHTKEATILPKMKGNKISKLIIPKNLRTTCHEYTAIFTEHGGLSLPSKNIDKGAWKKVGSRSRVSFSLANKGVSRGREKKLVGGARWMRGRLSRYGCGYECFFENQDEEGARKTSPSRSPLMAPRIQRARLGAL